MIPSFHASFLSRKQILESGTRFRLNQECWISHSESGWHDGLVVLLLLGKLAGVRMPVWKKDSLTAVASPLKWGRVMEAGGVGPGMQCGAKADAAHCVGHRTALRRHMQRTALGGGSRLPSSASPPASLPKGGAQRGSHCSICVSGQLMRKTFSVARVRAV